MRKHTDEFRKRVRTRICVYCGEYAETLDHFPPRSYGNHGWLLPACKECNCLAGTMFPYSFEYRAATVREKLRARYKKELAIPGWDELELSQISSRLRRDTEAWLRRRKRAQERIAWNAMAHLRYIVPISDFVLTYVEEETSLEKEIELFVSG